MFSWELARILLTAAIAQALVNMGVEPLPYFLIMLPVVAVLKTV